MENFIVKDVELPFFPGFYYSELDISDGDINAIIDNFNEYYPDEKEITFDDLIIDSNGYETCIMKHFVSVFEDYLPSWVKSIEEPELDKPREYNFRTDRVYVTLTLADDWKTQMQQFVSENHEWLANRIKEDWSDKSGFWSFIKNDIDAFLMNLYDLKPEYVSIILQYAIELKNAGDDMYDVLVYETLEEFDKWHSAGEFITLKNETKQETINAENASVNI